MKTKLSALTVALLFNFVAFTQDSDLGSSETWKDKAVKKISINPQIGWLHSWSDFKTDQFMPSFLQGGANELGLGLNLNYNLSKVLSISTGILSGELEGKFNEVETRNASNNSIDYGRGIQYNTNIFEFTLPRIDFNVTRLIFRDNSKFFNKVSIGLIASHGLVFYDSKIYAQSDGNVNLKYKNADGDIRGRTGKTTEGVTSFGGKLSYIINDKFDIGLESTIRNVNNDKLDAWEAGDFKDKYSFTAIGFTYHLKKREHITKKFFAEEDKLLAEENNTTEETEEVENIEVIEEVENIDVAEEVVTETIEEKKEVKPVETDGNTVSFSNEKVDVKKETKKQPTNTKPLELYEGYGNFVVVAAFKNLDRAQVKAQQLLDKGENPMIVKNRTSTWNIVAIDRYDDLQEALRVMRKARADGYERSWVLVKPQP